MLGVKTIAHIWDRWSSSRGYEVRKATSWVLTLMGELEGVARRRCFQWTLHGCRPLSVILASSCSGRDPGRAAVLKPDFVRPYDKGPLHHFMCHEVPKRTRSLGFSAGVT